MKLRRFLSLLLPSVIVAQGADLKTDSLVSANEYLVSRNCVKDCLWSGNWVGFFIGCGGPFYNQCFCNANLVSPATSYLSSCAIKYCTSEPDATSAVNIYAGYCSGAGYPIGESNVAIQTNTWTTIPPTGAAGTRSGVIESSGYSTSDKIALGVGIGFGIPATIAAISCVSGPPGDIIYEGCYVAYVQYSTNLLGEGVV
ncbi:hypothetical protein BKA65DRAFT_94941 [Rhexocercosporidium sp. MPI-PUGE-AT-0058]|nr:hypothetical protein BKA65DRAFT_94941 [Rhexocercosporidium sp. MPI-PUGE-AT-0058]